MTQLLRSKNATVFFLPPVLGIESNGVRREIVHTGMFERKVKNQGSKQRNGYHFDELKC